MEPRRIEEAPHVGGREVPASPRSPTRFGGKAFRRASASSSRRMSPRLLAPGESLLLTRRP